MMSYLLTSATAEELKAILLRVGLEILSEGGPVELARFFASEKGRTQDHLALIVLSGSRHDLTGSAFAIGRVADLNDNLVPEG
ncbi:MAG TPA: hypothetical protein VLV54_01520 [Thermoanaerobaculia bacterium]|nr:hypothetical protein [Thermoanaerobaculia bacterium]